MVTMYVCHKKRNALGTDSLQRGEVRLNYVRQSFPVRGTGENRCLFESDKNMTNGNCVFKARYVPAHMVYRFLLKQTVAV